MEKVEVESTRKRSKKIKELEKLCEEEWVELPKFSCKKLVENYRKRLEAAHSSLLSSSNPPVTISADDLLILLVDCQRYIKETVDVLDETGINKLL
ncbi:Hypothetical predicted protein [Octopus vulgaris]|uniref:Uncharacterized protein n=1 Tax=Octopus vulgaris TaxID=6645 RepID=A0AA36BDP2_OCTVU|nr:Hypothetical predicted protein [Octopus vulgaris]